MEGSASAPAPAAAPAPAPLNPWGIYNYEHVLKTLGSLQLRNDDDLQQGSSTSSESTYNPRSWSSSSTSSSSSSGWFSFGGSVFNMEVMRTREYINFLLLIEECQGEQLNFLVEQALSRPDLFLDAVFCRQGSSSIQKLIRKLKRSHHAFAITNVLSIGFWHIMTDVTAKNVIETCFVCFGIQPNTILFENAITHAKFLALQRVGCKSLQKCIHAITGEQKSRLLTKIADISYCLSKTTYGNYVVQEVLKLQNIDATCRILCHLKGHFIEMSQDKEASNVVDKCVELSVDGLISVVSEILTVPNAAFMLAQDLFGNYVIQKALLAFIKNKEPCLRRLHGEFIESLEPHHEELSQSVGGKNVIKLLRLNQKQLQWQSQLNQLVSQWNATAAGVRK